MNGDFAAGAVLISFGAVIGRITPTQLLTMAFFEIILYGLNNAVLAYCGLADIGGTYVIHMFGAYFGLTVSRVLSIKVCDAWLHVVAAHGDRWQMQNQVGDEDNTANYHSDVFSMIGTLFLWLFWPSFNGALAGDLNNDRHRAIINTLLSIASSAFTTFVMSRLLRRGHKFNMVDVQNATLAGGVAMGSCANMVTRPWGAMFIGLWAGMLSTWGYNVLQPILDRKLGLKDTCGINNLHGMPSIFGAFCSVVVTSASNLKQCECRMLLRCGCVTCDGCSRRGSGIRDGVCKGWQPRAAAPGADPAVQHLHLPGYVGRRHAHTPIPPPCSHCDCGRAGGRGADPRAHVRQLPSRVQRCGPVARGWF